METKIRVEPVVEGVRIFHDDVRVASLILTYEFRDVVTLSMAQGELTRKALRMVVQYLAGKGVRKLRCYRKNGQRMPGGVLVEVGEEYSLWESTIDVYDRKGE